MIVILDSNILGFLTNKHSASAEISRCQDWLYRLLSRGRSFYSSDICDYELRRELLRINSARGIEELDQLRELIIFCSVESRDLKKAAELWSVARSKGHPNKNEQNIDVDCILAAQCLHLQEAYPGRRVVLATTNLKDFTVVPDCAFWSDIS